MSSLGEEGALRSGHGCWRSGPRRSTGALSFESRPEEHVSEGALRIPQAIHVVAEYLQSYHHHVPGHFGNLHRSDRGAVHFVAGTSADRDEVVFCKAILGGIIAPTVAFPGVRDFFFADDVPFTWIARGLPLGSSTIAVQCKLQTPPATFIWAAERTLTLDVYKP